MHHTAPGAKATRSSRATSVDGSTGASVYDRPHGADAIAGRLRDCEASVLITADAFYRRG